jgi:hypothetical protein
MTRVTKRRLAFGGLTLALAAVLFAVFFESDTRLPCQKEVVFFDKWQGRPDSVAKARDNLASGNYTMKGRQVYSHYMPSDLEGALTLSDIDGMFAEEAGAVSRPGESPLVIDYRLMENDKYDPNKKNKPKKAFSGYLLVSFKLDKREVYRVQIDYLDPKGADLSRRIACVITSFRSVRK